ncbi:MAG: hypothetical protein XD76_0593 [candidate division TA06 bacterium 32_111]|uniref:Uncharacterized protein n=2 Tax=Bacteria candidate phyla TaxID=1783234 RepID=A0A101I3M8_UNCT6|nr:MAG: hypothetical protein XD76_0593 [candidate division TA06 bacterium 32_111]KUK87779.1 MAG: hypothetical protein XE03_0298 [candidate division TA06 bacterium 34_109]HAF07935.1 hypothetical protein [candidate division WOR-3 bacterium]HCP16363.1 hypothetical protein [candidate division WOR-3 bacterium]
MDEIKIDDVKFQEKKEELADLLKRLKEKIEIAEKHNVENFDLEKEYNKYNDLIQRISQKIKDILEIEKINKRLLKKVNEDTLSQTEIKMKELMEFQIDSLKSDIKKLYKTIEETKEENNRLINNLEKKINDSENNISENFKNFKLEINQKTDEGFKKIAKEIENLNQKISIIKDNEVKMENKTKNLDNKISAIKDNEFKQFKNKSENLEKEIINLKKEKEEIQKDLSKISKYVESILNYKILKFIKPFEKIYGKDKRSN